MDREGFGQLLAPASPRHRALEQLRLSFEAQDPGASLELRSDALVELARWTRRAGAVPPADDAPAGERPQVSRFRLIVRVLEELPPYRDTLASVVGSVLSEASALNLFAQLGLPSDSGLFGETVDRLSRRFLPQPMDPTSISELLVRLWPSARDIEWVNDLPAELLLRFARALGLAPFAPGKLWQPLEVCALDALRLIATRVSAVGLYDALRARSPRVPLEESPFFILPRATDGYVHGVRAGDAARIVATREQCLAAVLACRGAMQAIVGGLEGAGVSVDVVYRLELIDKNLARYADLLEPSLPRPELEHYDVVKGLLVSLLDARNSDLALGQIVRGSTHLLARKVIERAGVAGEHYITASRGEYLKMLASAGGGGVLTTFTTALKFVIGWASMAPFVEGMLSAANYAGSFITMQFCGFTLATKQPSVTAAALASSLRVQDSALTDGPAGSIRSGLRKPSHHTGKGLNNLVTLIARITRSQFAAALGNLGLVIPATIAFDYVYRHYRQQPFLDADTAHYVLHSFHPTQSGTLFYAALTGGLLWAASLGAGWLENWAAYRRIPEGISQHRLGRVLGKSTMRWLSGAFKANISGIGGNATLGLLLGMTPVLGKFFGLPLDVRHVTLSTGALTFAACSLGESGLSSAELVPAIIGVACMGLLNFGVSFILALLVALRARQVQRGDRLRLLSSLVATFLRSPLQFFLPPREPLEARVHGPLGPKGRH